MFKLALLQMETQWEKKSSNLAAAKKFIKSTEADLVVLPEMFNTGFTMKAVSVAEAMSGRSVSWLRDMAASTGSAIMGSLAIREESDDEETLYYNRLVFAAPDGDLQYYDKRHLFRMGDENGVYTRGKNRVVITYKGVRIMPIICYDLRFPVWCRNCDDYDLLINVACWPSVRSFAWNSLLRARAIENLCYVAGVNMVGSDPNAHYTGDSVIFDFMGKTMTRSVGATAQIIEQTFDIDALREFRAKFPAHLDADSFNIEI